VNQGALFSAFFGLIYVYIALAHRHRGLVGWLGAALAVFASLRLGHAVDVAELFRSINWNVLMIFGGILFIAEVMIDVGIPANLAGRIINGSRNYGWAAVLICALTGFLSIFVENVATVMIVAP
jgi:Na+/H+ antiporter NhaD/arsenite permease-like protein